MRPLRTLVALLGVFSLAGSSFAEGPEDYNPLTTYESPSQDHTGGGGPGQGVPPGQGGGPGQGLPPLLGPGPLPGGPEGPGGVNGKEQDPILPNGSPTTTTSAAAASLPTEETKAKADAEALLSASSSAHHSKSHSASESVTSAVAADGAAATEGININPVPIDFNSTVIHGADNGTISNGADSAAISKKGSNTGLIVGVVVGVVVGVALILALLFFCLRKKRRDKLNDSENETREALVTDQSQNAVAANAYAAASTPGGYSSPASSNGSGGMLAAAAAPVASRPSASPYRGSVVSMPEGDEARRALEDSIASDAFERAKAQANSKARDVAAETYRAPEVGARATDAADQAPPYWLTAGEEFGDDKQRRG